MITQQRLHELFEYSTLTGELIRRVATKGYPANRRITRKNDQGYLITMIEGKTYRVHRLVWLYHHGSVPEYLDHINRQRDDNRIENLRPCTLHENAGNCVARVHKYKGVTFCLETNKWRAQIAINKRNKAIGRFETIEEAAEAYNVVAQKVYGEFAVLNVIEV